MFILKVASLAAVPPNTTWPINFKGADGNDYWVRMKADPTGAISFAYGLGANAAADPASNFSAEGSRWCPRARVRGTAAPR